MTIKPTTKENDKNFKMREKKKSKKNLFKKLFPIAADIELSSVGPDGKIYIISKSRKLYLCFTKKGKLVTRVSKFLSLPLFLNFTSQISIYSPSGTRGKKKRAVTIKMSNVWTKRHA